MRSRRAPMSASMTSRLTSSMLEVKRLVMDADIGALRERMQRALDATDLTEQKSRLAELEAQ